MAASRAVTIALDGGGKVSGLLDAPADARAALVLAHGAGADMAHPFMAAVTAGLAARGTATLRYQFPYMERGSRRPDAPAVAQAAVRAAVAEAARRLPGMPLYAGGKSFGGRMTSQAQAAAPLASVRGLAFLGFPLHAPGKPGKERGTHLFQVSVPMLFLQGTRDDFARADLVESLVADLGPRATLVRLEGADHSFHVPVRSGGSDAALLAATLDALASWMTGPS